MDGGLHARQTSGCDLNGDGIPQVNALGPSTGYAAGTANSYAPGLKIPSANEDSVELEHQLPGNVVFKVGYTVRQTRNNIGARNVLVPASSYTPLIVTEATSGRVMTVYNEAPSLKGQISNVWSNSPLEDTNFYGWDASLSKLMSHHYSLLGGPASVEQQVTLFTPLTLLPAAISTTLISQQYRHGEVGNDVSWSYKVGGVYELPYGISASENTLYSSGLPDLTTVTVNSKTVALTQGSQIVTLAPRGTTRTPNLFDMDVSIQKPMKLGKTNMAPRIDFYNLTNADAVLTRVTTLGPSYLLPSTIEHGRVIKFGGTISF